MIDSCLGEFLDFRGKTINLEKSLNTLSGITSYYFYGSNECAWCSFNSWEGEQPRGILRFSNGEELLPKLHNKYSKHTE